MDQNLAADTDYTVIAVGKVATGSLEAVIIANPTSAVPAASSRAQVVHASPDAPQVDVYVTAPGADLTAEMPLGSFSYKEALGPVEAPAGDYQIRVTLPNDPTTVVFDSGTVNLSDGADLLIAAVNRTGAGTAPISLVVLDGQCSVEILDKDTPANVRAVHASPDAPPVDIVANDNFAAPLFAGVSFPGFSGLLAVPPATYNIKVVDAATQGVVAIDTAPDDLALAAGVEYTVLAIGTLAAMGMDPTGIRPLVLIDDNRRIATEAKVRIVHGSPTAMDVDIYVTAPGTDITDASVDPAFTDVPFGAETGYVPLAAGSYDISVTPAGDRAVIAIFAGGVTVEAGGIYTAVARDNAGGGAPLGLILFDDFVP